MGAFDTYRGDARCPRCGDVHHVDGQTKFFDPDFFSHHGREFRPYVPQPIDFPISGLRDRVWEDSWWRVRDPGDPERFDLLADFDDLFGCDCGAMFAVVLRFRVTDGPPPTAMLTAIELREHTSPAALAVDYADGGALIEGGYGGEFRARMAALAAGAADERAERLHEALVQRFTPAVPVDDDPGPWCTVRGPVRCEACGEVRARDFLTLLCHPDHGSFFGAGFTGGALVPGMRVAFDEAWLADDRDRGYHVRLRHPVPEDRLTVIGGPWWRSCRCGVGAPAPVLWFRREPGALVLAEVTLRAVRTAEDLVDVDFAESANWTREPAPHAVPRRWVWRREDMLRGVLGALGGA